MSSNKSVKAELIKRYGAECFIEKLHLRKDKEPRRYKSKGQRKRMKQLTFHHIRDPNPLNNIIIVFTIKTYTQILYINTFMKIIRYNMVTLISCNHPHTISIN